MLNFIQWYSSLPYTISIPVYLLVGIVAGLNYRFFFARHLWVRHQREARPEKADCWCAESGYSSLITRGDFVVLGIWTAPLLWPIHLPVALIILTFCTYGKLLRLIHGFAQRGARGMLEHIRTENELRSSLKDALSRLESAKMGMERCGKNWQESMKEASDLRCLLAKLRSDTEKNVVLNLENGRLKQNLLFAENRVNELSEQVKALKKEDDADARVDRALEKSQKLLDEVNAREAGSILCSKCGDSFVSSKDGSFLCEECR